MFGLSPRDEFSLFDPPTATPVTVGMAWTTLCQPDPTRVLLIIGSDAGGSVFLSLLGQNLGVTGGVGLTLTTAVPFIQLSYDQYGPLVQAGWQGSAAAPANCIVITATLSRDPALSGFHDLFRQRTGPTHHELSAALERSAVATRRPPARRLSPYTGRVLHRILPRVYPDQE